MCQFATQVIPIKYIFYYPSCLVAKNIAKIHKGYASMQYFKNYRIKKHDFTLLLSVTTSEKPGTVSSVLQSECQKITFEIQETELYKGIIFKPSVLIAVWNYTYF